MTSTPGHIYRVGTRFFVDSQAFDSSPSTSTWSPPPAAIASSNPRSSSSSWKAAPALPNQRGQLYLVPADSPAHGACLAWLRQGHMQGGGEFDVWPGGCACRLPTARETAE
jgi:hypothetical protein